MADSNNELVGTLPSTPNPALRTLDRLTGSWTMTGEGIHGEMTFEWLDGEFFFVQRFDLHHSGRQIKGVEYVGFDADTHTLRSHMMDNWGSNFTYTWQVADDELWIWFGEKGSDNFFRGAFDAAGDTVSGRWQWPEGDGIGGYGATMTRVLRG